MVLPQGWKLEPCSRFQTPKAAQIIQPGDFRVVGGIFVDPVAQEREGITCTYFDDVG
jgi:hypothetical protein